VEEYVSDVILVNNEALEIHLVTVLVLRLMLVLFPLPLGTGGRAEMG
jgi:hypothetical protein